MRRNTWKQSLLHILRGFRHAGEGVMDAYRSQKHMRFHFLAILAVALLSHLYRLETVYLCILTLSIALVVITELLNTVVESTLNLMVQTYHPGVRFAKDVAAGAVLIASLNAVVVGGLIFLHPQRLARLFPQGGNGPPSDAFRDTAVSIIVLLCLVVILKVGQRTGTVLRGGWLSGHSALAFCLATCMGFLSHDALVTLLAFLMALQVALTRVEAAIHTVPEVAIGALLGLLVPMVVFLLLP